MVSQKVLAATFLAVFITAPSVAQPENRPKTSATSQKPAPIDGEWIVADQTARIRIAPCGNSGDGTHCGTLVWTKTPGGVDSNNPDPAQRNKPLLGIEIIKGMRLKEQNLWEGTVYNATNGKTYMATLVPQSQTTLRIEGCILGGLLCDGEIWTRTVETGGTVSPKPADGTRPRSVQPR